MTELVSVVGGGNFETEFDLATLSRDINAYSTTYEPEVFAGLYFKLSESGPTTMLFANGKFNITGAKSIEHLYDIHDEVVSEIESIVPWNIPEHELQIRNLVYKHQYNRELELSQVAIGLGTEVTEYEPEQHPSLIYSPENSESGILLLFNSGAIIATGFKREDEAKEAIKNVTNELDTLFQDEEAI